MAKRMPGSRVPGQRRKAKRLRAHGLTLEKIGRRLGITKQGAAYLLQPRPPVRCRGCDAAINRTGALARDDRNVFCLPCLKRTEGVSAGVVLRSLRLAAGLTVKGLTERSGASSRDVGAYERGKTRMRPSTAAKVLRALGVPGAAKWLPRLTAASKEK